MYENGVKTTTVVTTTMLEETFICLFKKKEFLIAAWLSESENEPEPTFSKMSRTEPNLNRLYESSV